MAAQKQGDRLPVQPQDEPGQPGPQFPPHAPHCGRQSGLLWKAHTFGQVPLAPQFGRSQPTPEALSAQVYVSPLQPAAPQSGAPQRWPPRQLQPIPPAHHPPQ